MCTVKPKTSFYGLGMAKGREISRTDPEHPRLRIMLCTVFCILTTVCVYAQENNIQYGQSTVTFQEHSPLSSGTKIEDRYVEPDEDIGDYFEDAEYHYDLSKESFKVYIPKSYSPDKSSGLLVWISPGDNGNMRNGWEKVLDDKDLLWVGANKAGNKQSVVKRRIPLTLDGTHNMMQKYNIDPERVYISGFSGGGRVASAMAFTYPDIYAGAIFVCGVDSWETVPIPGKNRIWPADFERPSSKYYTRIKKRGRYVFLTGDKDFNLQNTKVKYEESFKNKLAHSLYIQVPEMGHSTPPAEWFRKALDFVDDPELRTIGSKGLSRRTSSASARSKESAKMRTWRSKSGATVKARLETDWLGTVVLIKADGGKIKIGKSDLSMEDQEYLENKGRP